MANQLVKSSVSSADRDNDYFTLTIVGVPSNMVLGKAFTKRRLRNNPTINVEATTSETWLSDPAKKLLTQQIKQSRKTMGLSFSSRSYSYTQLKKSLIWAFLLGFIVCAVLSLLLRSKPWLNNFFDS